MKKKFISTILALAMVLSMTTVLGFAEEVQPGAVATEVAEADAEARMTANVNFWYRRISDTSALAEVGVNFSRTADNYTVTITLQKKSNGNWVTASDVAGNTIIYKGSSAYRVYTSDSWTVKKGVVYRVKSKSTDSYDSGSSYTSTYYSGSF